MSSQARIPSLPDRLRRVDLRKLSTGLVRAVGGVLREIWTVVEMAGNLRNELRRMADESEASNPEYAARLRQAANSNWGE